jgi:hypothetical protein
MGYGTPGSIEGHVEGYTIKERNNYGIVFYADNICISRNGKRYYHEYRPSKADKKVKTIEQIFTDALYDFFASASIGNMKYQDYCDTYYSPFGDESDAEKEERIEQAQDMYRAHRRAYKALIRLAPDEALNAIDKGEKWLKSR